MTTEYLDEGRRIRVVLRFVPAALIRASDLVLMLEARPPNLQER